MTMPISLALTLAAVFLSVALMVGSAASFFVSRAAAGRRRLQTSAVQPVVLQELIPLSLQAPLGEWQALARFVPRSNKELEKLRLRLLRAGFRHPIAPIVYSAIELLAPFATALVPLFFLERPLAFLVGIGLGVLTFAAPSLVVGRRLAARRKEIENGLPDALDLMVVCMEAGSGLDQAVLKTGEELQIAYPTLADELRILNMEIRAGKSRLDAFKNLAQRTKVDDVRALVAMLIQTDRFGTSIGQALRTHAEVSRTKRRQRAEERAQKIGVKLVFPLVLLFFPAFFIVVLGPAIIQFARQFMVN